MATVRITNQGASVGPRTTVEIDGVDVSQRLRGVALDLTVGSPARLTVDLAEADFVFHGDAAVAVKPAAEQFLIDLGWTPPER